MCGCILVLSLCAYALKKNQSGKKESVIGLTFHAEKFYGIATRCILACRAWGGVLLVCIVFSALEIVKC